MLRTLIPSLALATPLLAQDGNQLFTTYCSACHAVDGMGATGGTFPPLAGSPWVAGDADRAIKIVLKGLTGPVEILGKPFNLEMPPQGATLADDQIAAILTHVRSSWGNQAATVSADQVKTVRASIADRPAPWTAAEILKLHPLPLEKTALTNLISQAYSGDWSSMPDFSQAKASNVEEEHDGIISLKKAPFEEHFAIVWQGDFNAPADGMYQFLLDADDAAAVIIDGKTLVEIKGAGPMNGSRSRQGKVKLTQGSHKFRVEFLEISDNQGIALGWKGPGSKQWKWLSDAPTTSAIVRDPIPVGPEDGKPVIYRNFITGTTPRSIGVGFPSGVNLAYSADNLAPELIWTGDFIDGGPKWIDRGTDNNPPAGDNVVHLTKSRFLPADAKFKGYKLDAAGNPSFSIRIGTDYLLDSWSASSGALVRKLALGGNGQAIEIVLADHPLGDKMTVTGDGAPVNTSGDKTSVNLAPGKPVTLTYRWK